MLEDAHTQIVVMSFLPCNLFSELVYVLCFFPDWMLPQLRDALESLLDHLESPRSPEWESHRVSDMMSTMDNIATQSYSQIASSSGGELHAAFQNLEAIDPQDEFQVAMTQYARASLKLLEGLRKSVLGGGGGVTPSTALPDLGDLSKCNLLQSLTDYTNSRLTLANLASFPSTPFSEYNSFIPSVTQSHDVSQDVSPTDIRPSMTSMHLLDGGLESQEPPSRNGSYFGGSGVFETPIYEPLSTANVSTVCPSTIVHVTSPSTSPDCVSKVIPSKSHDKNTAFCAALATQALKDLLAPPPTLTPDYPSPPKLRPLGGSNSFRLSSNSVRPVVLPRTHSLNDRYMTYRIRRTSSTPTLSKAPRKPARQVSVKSAASTGLRVVKRVEEAGSSRRRVPSSLLLRPLESDKKSLFCRTRSLLRRTRFGSFRSKKSLFDKMGQFVDKAKTL